MFDHLFDGMMPYQQILLLAGGFVCLSLGVLFAGNEIYWRRKALRVAGVVAGVRHKGNVYYPVYRYQLPDGRVGETSSDIGSSGFAGKETGRMAPLLVFPDDPPSARTAGNWAFAIFGALLMLPGALLIYMAFTRYPVTKMSWYMAVALFCYSGMKLQHMLVPRGQHVSLAAWKSAMKRKHEAEMQGLPVLRIEDAMQAAASVKTQARQANTLQIWGPAVIGLGTLLLCLGVNIGDKVENTLRHGVTAQGQVVRLQAESAESDTLYPVVSFTDASGRRIQFRDIMGQDPPELHAGETVPVIYLPGDPANSALVDRGARNYLAPLLLLVFGVVFCISGAVIVRGARRRGREEAPNGPV